MSGALRQHHRPSPPLLMNLFTQRTSQHSFQAAAPTTTHRLHIVPCLPPRGLLQRRQQLLLDRIIPSVERPVLVLLRREAAMLVTVAVRSGRRILLKLVEKKTAWEDGGVSATLVEMA